MILVDTGALYALADRADRNHPDARSFIESRPHTARILVTPPVLVELWYLVRSRKNRASAFEAVHRAMAAFELLVTDAEDLTKALRIREAYPDQKFSIVDCLTMAACERYRIEGVFTFDRRDFSIFRPSFCPALTLLP